MCWGFYLWFFDWFSRPWSGPSRLVVVSYQDSVSIYFLVDLSLSAFPLWGWGCSSIGRASDRHADDADSIPRCGKEFFCQSQLSELTFLRCPYTPVLHRMHLHLYARYRFRSACQSLVDSGNAKTPSMHHKLCSMTLWQLAFLGEGNPNFSPPPPHHHQKSTHERTGKSKPTKQPVSDLCANFWWSRKCRTTFLYWRDCMCLDNVLCFDESFKKKNKLFFLNPHSKYSTKQYITLWNNAKEKWHKKAPPLQSYRQELPEI